MAESTKLRVTELDFDEIKSNLKDYLQSQAEFTDYDFEGSALSNLLDLLAYNTHYNAIYANLIANEMFLDSASKRASVVSLAKHFGYTPRSVISPRARINLQVVVTGTPQSLTLPKYTTFTTSFDGLDYTYYNLASVTATPSAPNSFLFNNVEIVEGKPLSYRYTVANGQNKFLIPNDNVDTSTLLVEVQNSAVDTTLTTFTLADEIVAVTGASPVYFLEETRDGLYQLVFGDGSIGKSLVDGNIVRFTYLTSNGTLTNNANSFNLGSTAGFTVVSYAITLSSKSAGGRDKETVNSIKYNAPKFFVSQNRAVTAEDYKNIILAEYPDIEAISAWGGEVNDPPIYGKVFIVAKPTNGLFLSSETKDNLVTILKNKNVVGITPEFIDPDYLYVTISTNYFYDPSQTTIPESTLNGLVRTTIQNYRDSDLDNFDVVCRKSKLGRLIDYTNKCILNNNTNLGLYKYLPVNNESEIDYVIKFVNPISSVSTTSFRIVGDSTDYYFDDDGAGNLVLYYFSNNSRVNANTAFGTVNYSTGELNIPNVAFSQLTDNCKIIVVPTNPDIRSVRNQIITLVDSDITVSATIDLRKPLIR